MVHIMLRPRNANIGKAMRTDVINIKRTNPTGLKALCAVMYSHKLGSPAGLWGELSDVKSAGPVTGHVKDLD
jgi:hypothetical protein